MVVDCTSGSAVDARRPASIAIDSDSVILGYACEKTEAFARGEFVAAFQGFEDQAAKRLAILNAAGSLQDLRAIRSNRLESLAGTRKGQNSIRINRQWRICFIWAEAKGPTSVEIVDCH